jgi:hypothetical protein
MRKRETLRNRNEKDEKMKKRQKCQGSDSSGLLRVQDLI